ncbi:hypothetical protein OROGR_000563 [Orobanche gracilis]
MGEIVFFNLKYDGEAKLISVNSTTSFDDFIAQASGKWNELSDLNLLLRYSIGDVRNCNLDCEDDLRNLFSICQILSAKIVFVDISKIVEKQILTIEQQTDTFDQHEHAYDPNEHVHVDHLDVHVDHTTQVDHSCIGKLAGNKNTHFGAKISGNLVVKNIRADPNCNGKDIQKTLRLSYVFTSRIGRRGVLTNLGTLLGATGKDGDNGLLPVAIAIVSAENTSNWVWFLEKPRGLVHHEKENCYLSDRNTGLMSAFPKGWTNDQRENLGVHFKNCAYAPNIRIFNEKVAIFKAVGGRAAEEWISELPLDKWVVAHSPNIKRYGEMMFNAAGQFNALIKEARSLPITYMIEHIRRVDLQAKECSCYQWQVRGFPCVHAVAVIIKKCPTVYSIVEEHFFTNTYRACYSFDIHAIPQTEKFEFQPSSQNSTKLLPPIMKRQPGRPKGKRKPSFGEFPKKKPTKACVRCGNFSNHDPTTCLLPPEKAMWF